MATPQIPAKPRTAKKSVRKPTMKAVRQGRNDTQLLLSSSENAGRLRAAIKQANAFHRFGKTGTAAT